MAEIVAVDRGNVMRALGWICLFVFCCAISRASAAPQGSMGDPDRAAIEKAVQNYMDSWNRHDVKAVVMTYTEDTDVTNAFGTVYHGRAAMEATFGPMLAGVYSETHQTGVVRSVRFFKPDVAAVDVDWQMTGAKNADGSVRPTRKGIHSMIMTKQSDGSWLIAMMHIHEFTNTPPLTPQNPPPTQK